jgi:hypothetical protein
MYLLSVINHLGALYVTHSGLKDTICLLRGIKISSVYKLLVAKALTLSTYNIPTMLQIWILLSAILTLVVPLEPTGIKTLQLDAIL